MILSREHDALFSLLRAGLWEKEPDNLSPFPLTDAQWWTVYRMAVRQTVSGIVWRGLHHLPDPLLPCDALMIRWVAKADSIERQNRKMNAAVDSLLRLMQGNGLHPVLLKGQGAADFYEHPLLRECGDIDLYFPSGEEERQAARLVRRTGCLMEKQPDGSSCYSWQGVEVEHHTRLFDIYDPCLKGYLSSLTRKYGFTELPSGNGRSAAILVPSPLPCLLMLNAHLLKHLMGHGIGLRQFCDMARAYHVLRGSYSPEEMKNAYKRAGLLEWNKQLHTLLTEHLGLDYYDLPYIHTEACTSPMLMRIILDGGNFGQHGETSGRPSRTGWKRKLHTLLSFWQRRDFSCAYAPKEAFWTSMNLMIGNLTRIGR